MPNNQVHLAHARSLRADILAAPSIWLPRRDILLDWLSSFVVRAEAPSYALADTEAADLAALDEFIRGKQIPIAG